MQIEDHRVLLKQYGCALCNADGVGNVRASLVVPGEQSMTFVRVHIPDDETLGRFIEFAASHADEHGFLRCSREALVAVAPRGE